jgi:glyoxylase-like metal-dependent hydrolase (beta-lactamase superfamily II)
MEEILPNLYRTEIPLPESPLKSLNSYLIKGDGRFLIIDTGMNREECKREMLSSLKRLQVDLNKTDFFITHFHVDHIGLTADLATETSKTYLSEEEAFIFYNSGIGGEEWRQKVHELFLSHGFPEDELREAEPNNPGLQYGLKYHIDFTPLKEGDAIQIGDYDFRCIETPGHSPGHMCLYEADKKILVSGDHILFDITPNIAFWMEMENPLQDYLENLEKVYNLDVNLVLPGHRNIWHDHRQRIAELQEHHQFRLNEIIAALQDGDKTAFDITPWVSWDMNCNSWEEFPLVQKRFAVGETMSHLRYLEVKGVVERKTEESQVVFSLV